MTKPGIDALVVVEGHHDTAALKRVFDVETIETGGLQLRPQTLETIAAMAKSRDIIIFTDPDSPGEVIRRRVAAVCPDAKHIFIEKKKARTAKKVGVEHASDQDLLDAFFHVLSLDPRRESLSWAEYVDCGLTGNRKLRELVCSSLHIGPCNNKTCFKRLNQMGVDRAALERIVHECH